MDHPDVASTYFRIARQYSNLGQHEKALQAFQEVLGKELICYQWKQRFQNGKEEEKKPVKKVLQVLQQ